MTFADFKTEINNTPVMLKIASLMYIIPALALFVFILVLDNKEHGNFNVFLIYFIYALYNMMIAIWQDKKNIVIWWASVILPAGILVGIFLLLNNDEHSDSTIYLIYSGYLLFNLLIGIGLYKKNIIKWCAAMILPYVILVYTLSSIDKVEYREFVPQLIFSGFIISIMMIGFGLFKKNVVAKWIALILPHLITGFGILFFICWLDEDQLFRDVFLIVAIIFVASGLYFTLAAFFITRPKIKVLFKKAVKEEGV